uniref:NAD(P)H-quinone oxidoreductase subunit 2, chloroplastic n=1 Tax=Mesostigma viride TaxID=41882 RepID=NU2C_MESVI|nr:NADH dehydrogenase subunit 2 [Mesostigma viride]Q9MUQ6.1 RecName: Full=NAD(P)H-quinone oxidoreductase subunit 2, chloroplastic; AltName: Full=NAD(P)H dehydrogenase, subunit 2; AltName: Full=NADH-plastoquinone oxidoreductase subunit 2 [Mesostigma viride]AAF43844.1 subunit 2 of NADH-plastoquinoneoxidoreductase [Mesostigma viride]WKT08207.1 subunit 2 of NADH-plastoquinone oxidoreductase [Mesostigma viride]|eukprot:jgi/Mesvir1/6308/Mv26426-RA.1
MEFKDLIASLNIDAVLPEAIIICSSLFILIIDLIFQRRANAVLPYMAILGLILSMLSLLFQWNGKEVTAFLGSFQTDSLSIAFRLLIALSSMLCVLLSIEYLENSKKTLSEFLVIFLTATLGAMLLCGSNDILMIFLSLETLGLCSYILTGYMKKDIRSNEASIKYLLIGAASSSILLYGFSLLYGLSHGHIEIHEIAANLIKDQNGNSLASLVALALIIVGISFKIAAAPFHQWAPDVYEGAPTPVVAFLSVSSKAAGLMLATRIMTILFPYIINEWHNIFQILAILSMAIGNIIAISQTNIKRMLGYSSIAQAGFLLVGLLAGNINGYSSMLVYMLIYLFMNLGAFACVILFSLKTGSDQIRDYGGLYLKDPILALCLSICLLSLGGIPPFGGFFGKLYLFWAGWEAGSYLLVFVGLLTSVISIFYYIKIIKMMIIKESPEVSFAIKNYSQKRWSIKDITPIEVSILICVIGTTISGIFVNPIISIAQQTVIDSSWLMAI